MKFEENGDSLSRGTIEASMVWFPLGGVYAFHCGLGFANCLVWSKLFVGTA